MHKYGTVSVRTVHERGISIGKFECGSWGEVGVRGANSA